MDQIYKPTNADIQAVLRSLTGRLKRAATEELLSPIGNGSSLGIGGMTVDHVKKAKLDGDAVAALAEAAVAPVCAAARSRVVHLRNIPPDMSDVELIHMCVPFGRLTNFLLLKGKNQAFVEFEDEQSSSLLVSVTASSPISLRGRTIFCQYSNHQQLKTDSKNAFNASTNPNLVPVLSSAAGLTTASANGVDVLGAAATQPNSVLRVIIENMLYPVTLDVLYSIFTRFGKVLRIITFSKNNTFQALIQLADAQCAQLAKQALDGQNVYNGCCTLRIDCSKLATLNVKYNNDKSRDYTNPNLPSGELTLEQQIGLAAAGVLNGNAGAAQNLATLGALQSQLAAAASMPVGSFAGLPTAAAFHELASSPAGAAAAMSLGGLGGLGGLQMTSAGLGMGMPVTTQAQAAAVAASLGSAARAMPQFGVLALPPVVLVSNLDEARVTPDALFTLFGVYGDVQRVKILFNKKDNALIQYAEPAQAQLSIQHLDKAKLYGKQIRVAASKHNNVQMPKEGQPDAGLTKDYSQSPLHRFKKPGSKNYMNIYPPSNTLHLSNIPPNITDEFLVEAFTQLSCVVKAFKFFPKDHKMALIQLETIDEAIEALIALHNFKLADNAHLRVSFSKSGI